MDFKAKFKCFKQPLSVSDFDIEQSFLSHTMIVYNNSNYWDCPTICMYSNCTATVVVR